MKQLARFSRWSQSTTQKAAIQSRNKARWQLSSGLVLTSALALLATYLHTLPKLGLFSPLILAILLGIAVRNTVGTPQICQPGITFSLKRILKFAIVLLGLQLSVQQVIEVGAVGLGIVAATLLSTFVFTCWLGKRLGVGRKLTQLIAAGTSICGASAVIATNVIVEGHDEDVAYAVAMVTVFGTASMLLYPLLPGLLHLSPQAFGIWCGASIHEVAQVIAAAFQDGMVSGQVATISKLSRVMLLAPMVLTLGVISAGLPKRGEKLNLRQVSIPWFVLYFVAVIVINSLNILPEGAKAIVIQCNQFLLAVSLAAMGLETNLHKMIQAGLKPLYLGAASWLFVSGMSLGLVCLFYR